MPSEPHTTPTLFRPRLTIRALMFVVVLVALTLANYGWVRRDLAGRALAESLSAPGSGTWELGEVKRLHAERSAAAWLAGVIREDREGVRSGPPRGRSFLKGELAFRHLSSFGLDADPAIPELIHSARTDPRPWMRSGAVATLGAFVDSDDRAFATLVEIIKEARVSDAAPDLLAERAGDALAISKSRRPVLLPILIDLLEDREEAIQERAFRMLGMMGADAKPAVPALLRSLRSRSRNIRSHGLGILTRVAPVDATLIEAIRPLENDEDKYVARQARRAVADLTHRIEVLRRDEESRRALASDGRTGPKLP